MFKFIFGLIWTFISSILLLFWVSFDGDIVSFITNNTFVFLIFAFFEGIGIILIISGLLTIIKDRKTEKYGFECYGIVRDIVPTGSYVNDNPEYKVLVDVANTETYQVEEIGEITGFDYNKYPIDTYVLCKYYKGDINIIKIVSENEVPKEVRESIYPVNKD